ncbi:hypothetical protein Q4511_03750 [Paracoccus sp. 1_MG-2023]|uniref:hypothetical protein n=1 Tax=unclassified Paracoccus (in: a-proteobacteria) TaxID=2688777 RepID=UPI001C08DB02|nr:MULTISPECIES: hypothetical protein [unclassified Paracoccus (in: a-proteobacteria)]MBU2956350.1 hypothetical protein [Paracoccus sp. C2R09]MDO6668026.1 hypothetical protein [Paracoccus sp. 1_MG-2023]
MPFLRSFGPLADRRPCHAPVDATGAGGQRLTGLLTDINISGSQPALQVRAADGFNWTVDLSSHARNRAAGLEDAPILPGDPVEVFGNASGSLGEYRIRAHRLIIAGRRFDLPEGCAEPA